MVVPGFALRFASRCVLVLAVLALSVGAASLGQAAPLWFECNQPNVTVWTGNQTGRIELFCATPYNGAINYFTFPTSRPADADRVLQMAGGHDLNTVYYEAVTSAGIGKNIVITEHRRVSQLWIFFDPDDLSGAAYGCLNKDCRNILALRLVPLNFTGVVGP